MKSSDWHTLSLEQKTNFLKTSLEGSEGDNGLRMDINYILKSIDNIKKLIEDIEKINSDLKEKLAEEKIELKTTLIRMENEISNSRKKMKIILAIGSALVGGDLLLKFF